MRRRAVAIIGGRAGNSGPAALPLAEAVGAELARRGYAIVSGGDSGVAAAANKGCVLAGGTTVALLKWNRADDCGPDVTWSIPTSMDLARSNILNWSGDGVIAFEGRYGTLAEIALALDTGRPLVVVGDQPLLAPEALSAPTCRVFSHAGPADAAAVVTALEDLIGRAVPAPARPAAPLFPDPVQTSSGIGLRRALPADREVFRRAFLDPRVRAWWDLDPTDTALERFWHDRCLVVSDAERPVGFLEYHADPDPDFDHLGVDLVISDESDRGRGLGSTALREFAAAAFLAGHHRITVVPSPANIPAVRCYEKVGFGLVGLMRDYERHQGQWRDAALYDLLPTDLVADPGGVP